MKLTFLGAASEVGRSAILLDTEKRLMLDYGIKLAGIVKGAKNEYPMMHQGKIDTFILSHAHLDHSGCAPALATHENIPTLATYCTKDLCSLMLKDSLKVARLKGERAAFSPVQLRKFEGSFVPLEYDKTFKLAPQTEVTMYDAGHVPGAAITRINTQGKRIVYTGDFKMDPTRLHAGAKPVEGVDVLIIESTYNDRDHPDRTALDKKVASEVRATVESGGTALFPAFALGRSQELLLLASELLPDVRVYLDGMSKAATELIANHPEDIRNIDSLRQGMKNAIWLQNDADRKKAATEPGMIISSAGMLEGGPAVGHLLRLNSRSKIYLTGYQVEGTNARTLLESKTVIVDGIKYNVSVPVEYVDMSAHAGRKDLMEFIRKANPQKIFCIHGEKCAEFAAELNGMGFEAHAPKRGQSYEL